ncbi:hypothetical protein GOP47_0027222 [Adiantum capillus-veneris]|nr:hypothetical protein GOP47_0027222 [Adiantum capillus-veneris]
MESAPGVPGEHEQDESARSVLNSGEKRSEEDASTASVEKWPGWPGDNVYRLIIPIHKVGSIIGRKGEHIKKMCEETRCRIKILDGSPSMLKRVVMISARNEPEVELAPAINGLLRVHECICNDVGGEEVGSTSPSRLLIPATQAGYLIGKQGTNLNSIQDATGAKLWVLPADQVPSYALQEDRVVEIQGEGEKVSKALKLVASRLQKFLVDHSVLPLFEAKNALQSPSQQGMPMVSWGSGLATSIPGIGWSGVHGSVGYSAPPLHNSYHQSGHTFDSQPQMHSRLSVYGRDPAAGILSSAPALPPFPIIAKVTHKLQIPLAYMDSIIGIAGSNISYIRRTSGAIVTMQEVRGSPGEMTMEIHGTASEVQAAEQMVQQSMAGAYVPTPHYSSTLGLSTTPYESLSLLGEPPSQSLSTTPYGFASLLGNPPSQSLSTTPHEPSSLLGKPPSQS